MIRPGWELGRPSSHVVIPVGVLSNDVDMSIEGTESLFLGFGMQTYCNQRLNELGGTAAEVHQVSQLVGDHFTPVVLQDATETQVRQELRSRAGYFSAGEGKLVMMWSGHGREGAGDDLYLLSHDDPTIAGHVLTANEVAGHCAATGANQMLFIIDTCYSGRALSVGSRIDEYFRDHPAASAATWCGVLVACGPRDAARTRVLGEAIVRLLRYGPRLDGPHAQDVRRRWTVHQELIRGDDLCWTLIKELEQLQVEPLPTFDAIGHFPLPMIRNPLWRPAATAATVREVLTATPSRRPFFGRRRAVSTISEWIEASHYGIYLITGGPGAGKSALLAQTLRQVRTSSDRRSVAVSVNVSNLNLNRIVVCLEQALVDVGVLDSLSHGRNPLELSGALKRLVDDGEPVPVVGIDGLDQATDVSRVIDELLTPLSRAARVVVAARPIQVPSPQQRQVARPGEWSVQADHMPIAAVLTEPQRMLDLDASEQRASGWQAIKDLLKSRLAEIDTDIDHAAVFDALQRALEAGSTPPFVLANLVVDRLRTASPGVGTHGFDIAESVGAALDDLVALSYNDAAPTRRAKCLLQTLAFGLGAGLPEAEWLAIANGVSWLSEQLSREDIADVLAALSDYIVEDSESGYATYRFSHALITQHFANQARAHDESAPLRVAAALTAAARALNPAPHLTNSPHLRRYLWCYVAQAAEPGLDLLRGNPLFAMDLVAAALAVSAARAQQRQLPEATHLAEEAVTLLTDLDHTTELDEVLPRVHLAAVQHAGGEITNAVENQRRAVEIIDQHGVAGSWQNFDHPAILCNYANMLIDAQRPDTAITAARQAVELEEKSKRVGANNGHRLGAAHNTLSLAYNLARRHSEAVAASRDAVRALENSVSERDNALLAQALQNLGSRLADVGKCDEALNVTERSRRIARELTQVNPIWREVPLGVLGDLAVRHEQCGYQEQALALMATVVEEYSAVSLPTAHQAIDRARALSNYSHMLQQQDRSTAALKPAYEAVQIMEELAAREKAHQPALALTLNNYANALTKAGHHTLAMQATENALWYYRQAWQTNLGLNVELAKILCNYSHRLAAAARFTDAINAASEAITVLQPTAADDPQKQAIVFGAQADINDYRRQLGLPGQNASVTRNVTQQAVALAVTGAMSPSQLADLYTQTARSCADDPAQALDHLEHAVAVLREAGMSNTSMYGRALRNTAMMLGETQQLESALNAASEAVLVFSRLAQADSSHRYALASAQGTQAKLLQAARCPTQARDTAIESLDNFCRVPQWTFEEVVECGRLLALLASILSDLGHGLAVLDAHVQRCASRLHGYLYMVLHANVIHGLPASHPRTPRWIYEAISAIDVADPKQRFGLGQLARPIRSTDPARFDELWQQDTGVDIPKWITIDDDKVQLALAWISCQNYTAAADFLQQHPELLGDDFTAAIDEVYALITTVEPARVDALRTIRELPHTSVAFDLAEAFLAANLRHRLQMLNEHSTSLRVDWVNQHLQKRVDSPRLPAAAALLALHDLGLGNQINAVITAVDRAEQLLTQLTVQYGTAIVLLVTTVLLDISSADATPEVRITASFYVAAGLVDAGLLKQARELITTICQRAPHRVLAWKELCNSLSGVCPHFPRVAALLDQSVGANE